MDQQLTLADDAIKLLTVYLTSYGGQIKDMAAGIRRIIDRIRSAFSSSGYDEGAVDRLIADPASQSRQKVMVGLLAEALENDAELRESLRSLLQEAQATFMLSDAGAVAVYGDVRLRGKYVAGRDLHIGTPAPGQGDE
jgi:hypothetical protein